MTCWALVYVEIVGEMSLNIEENAVILHLKCLLYILLSCLVKFSQIFQTMFKPEKSKRFLKVMVYFIRSPAATTSRTERGGKSAV